MHDTDRELTMAERLLWQLARNDQTMKRVKTKKELAKRVLEIRYDFMLDVSDEVCGMITEFMCE